MFLIIVVALFLISFIMAIFALKKEIKKPQEIERVEKELKREKIIYHS